MYCLWLNGKKIFTASEIPSNFDAMALCGYFLAGSLSRWLRDLGEIDLAERVDQIDPDAEPERALAAAFGVKMPIFPDSEPFQGNTAPISSPSLAGNSFVLSSFLAEKGNSFSNSFALGSFLMGSFSLGSFMLSSFSLGSFTLSSFSLGSFMLSSFSLGSFMLSSFSLGSFMLGSFSLGSFTLSSFSLGSFMHDFGSFVAGSFSYADFDFKQFAAIYPTKSQPAVALTAPEKTALNLSLCPMNRFGYGIHIV